MNDLYGFKHKRQTANKQTHWRRSERATVLLQTLSTSYKLDLRFYFFLLFRRCAWFTSTACMTLDQTWKKHWFHLSDSCLIFFPLFFLSASVSRLGWRDAHNKRHISPHVLASCAVLFLLSVFPVMRPDMLGVFGSPCVSWLKCKKRRPQVMSSVCTSPFAF